MICKMQYLPLLLIIVAASQERHNNQSFQWKDLDLLPTGQSRSAVSTDGKNTLKSLLQLNKNSSTLFSNSSIRNTNLEKAILNHFHEKAKRDSDIQKDSILLNRGIRSNNPNHSSVNSRNYHKRNAAAVESHDVCVPDVKMDTGSKEIIDSKVKKVTLCCKFKENFEQIKIQILSDSNLSSEKNTELTNQELGITNYSLWYRIDIEAYVDTDGVDEWFIRASVDGNQPIKKLAGYKFLTTAFKGLKVNALGPSLCSKESPLISTISPVTSTISPVTSTVSPVTSTISPVTSTVSPITSKVTGDNQTDLNLIVIVVPIICIIVVLVFCTIVALLIRKKFSRNRPQPTENLELGEQGAGNSTETGGPHPEPRPQSSHDSENSLYGFIN